MKFVNTVSLAALTDAGIGSGSAGAEDAAGTWSKKAPMRHARNELQAAAVNGKIYVIGGGYTETKDGKPADNITSGYTEEYDPATDTWRERAPMPEGGTHNGIAVLDGKIYIAGGFAGNRHTLPTASLHSYDPGDQHVAKAHVPGRPAWLDLAHRGGWQDPRLRGPRRRRGHDGRHPRGL